VHGRYTALMSLQLDGEASPSEQLELWQHLAECSECTAIWAQWQALDELLSGTPAALPPRELTVSSPLSRAQKAPRTMAPVWLWVVLLLFGVLWLCRSWLAVMFVFWWGWLNLPTLLGTAAPLAEVLSKVRCELVSQPTVSIALAAFNFSGLVILATLILAGFVGLTHSPCARR
jgi:anti-sigma factor RsiW